MSETRRRQKLAGFRCTDAEMADIEAAAAQAGQSKAAFIREATIAQVVELGMSSVPLVSREAIRR